MSTVTPTSGNPTGQNNTTSIFDNKLNIAKSSQIIADYMRQTGKSAITGKELSQLANDTSGKVSADVKDAASYMQRHPSVFTAIETHDVPGADDLSGVWNFDWAAKGGLNGTPTDAIARMQDVFDFAIEKSAKITQITTAQKTELDATKQRPSN